MAEETPKNVNNKTKGITQSQDKLFRDLLSDEKEVEKIIKEMLIKGEKITYKELEKYNSSFINSQYRNKEADIVYKLKNTNTFFLIEHQSYIDYSMSYRILEYGTEIIRSAINNKKKKQKNYIYPKVYLLVLYTGAKKWSSSVEYKEIADKVLKDEKYTINAEYGIIDIHKYKKEELIKDECIIKNVMGIGKCKTAQEVKDTLDYLITNSKTKEKQYKIWKIAKYIFPKIVGEKYIEKILEMQEKEEVNMFGMLEENLKKEREQIVMKAKAEGKKKGLTEGKLEGKIEGKIEGKLEGKLEEKIELIKNMIKEKISIETISKVTKLSKEEIENYI